MSLKRLRKTFGCFVLSISMLMSMPAAAFAAESTTESATESIQGDTQEASTPGNTESETPSQPEEPEPTEVPEPVTEPPQTDTIPDTTAPTDSNEPTTDIIPPDDGSNQDGSGTQPGTGDQTDKPDDGGISQTEKPDEDPDKDDDANIKGDKEQEDHSDANANLSSNIIAGNGVYLERLAGTYGIRFEDNFEEVMNQIEAEYKEWLDKPDAFVAGNWQDVLAVYILRHREATGSGSVVMNADAKDELSKVFFLMNIRSDSGMANKLSAEVDKDREYYPMSVKDYAELRNVSGDKMSLLEKYTSSEAKQLCAMVTASTGFVRAMAGEGVSEQRIQIVKAACSLIGKVGYFWGGKSYAMGWDASWGSPVKVTAAGSRSTGSSRGYGLDCSGFVCWSYYNGLKGTDGGIGNHTTTQWNSSAMVDSNAAQPGDMVFYNSPIAGDQNHVGVVIGKNSDGSMVVAHCSSSRNGVVVGEAWSQGFKYVRSPLSLK